MFRDKSVVSWLIAVSFVLILTTGIASAATVTQSISFQGNLTNAAGTPLTGTFTVIFRLYNVASGGTALATDTHSVTAAKGQYTTTLNFPATYYNGQGLWLGIQRAPDAEKSPRTYLRPVPYALSLRPGAVINGSGTTPVLSLTKKDNGGSGLNVKTSGYTSNGIDAFTSGASSKGVNISTTGTGSLGIVASTSGQDSDGFFASTSGTNSHGLTAITTGTNSHGLYAGTFGVNSDGLYARTYGANSYGLFASTSGASSNGVNISTSGFGSKGIYVSTSGQQAAAVHAIANGIQSNAIVGETNANGAAAVAGVAHGTGTAYGVYAVSNQATGLWAHTIRPDQKYGIYTPDYLYAKGTQVPASDVAEYMPVTGDATPGTVLVIGDDGKLQPSITAYDTRVAGIISTAPGVTLGTKDTGNPGEAVIAVAGRVPCKVDATKAPIHAGDLLTTSDNPGYAMKAEQVSTGTLKFYLPGTVIGKAMGSLESGTGTIEVLVTLQ